MNQHYTAAQDLISNDKSWGIGWETADAQHLASHLEANMEATLALAYEQRTANLIAMFGEGTYHSLNNEQRKDLLGQIEERLGLA